MRKVAWYCSVLVLTMFASSMGVAQLPVPGSPVWGMMPIPAAEPRRARPLPGLSQRPPPAAKSMRSILPDLARLQSRNP